MGCGQRRVWVKRERPPNPPAAPAAILEQVRSIGLQAFQRLGCRGLVRFDFMLDQSTETLYLNEVNPLPGSFAYYLWEQASPKLSFTELLSILVDQAIADRKERSRSRRSFERRLF